MTKTTFNKKNSITIITGITIVLITSLLFISTSSPTLASHSGTMITDEKFVPFEVTTDSGLILGYADNLAVEHPMFVTGRNPASPPGDPNDPDLIAEAYVKNTWTGITDNDGNPIAGATVSQYWIGVSPEESVALGAAGYTLTGSSGGFMFKLVSQTASPEAEAAFGAITIDNTATGEPILAVGAATGWCG